jgi:hypothetical protein
MSDRRMLLLSESFLRAIGALAHYDRATAEKLFADAAVNVDADIAGAGRRFFVETAAAPAGRADPLPPSPLGKAGASVSPSHFPAPGLN